ncbi:radical SAM protein [Dehalobacter sp. TeCB1]|uniref:radical SAM protein n=1 Tax=Dehalobacter sp. TeCB1 TaxID=1843715 RepID=UPI00083AB38E|nr:radical SAM protein [Dehalobacter sp. TeCB1]OCZ51364.1 radical SAM protein [Dehalobacter sp. TeCB1]
MNIMLNNYCNLKCPYCFASCDPKNMVNISDENYAYILDFFKRSGHFELRLLGGEPTLHPNFVKWVNDGVRDPFFQRIMIFTNALALESKVSDSIVDNKVSFLVNLNGPTVIGEHLYNKTIDNVENLIFGYRRRNIDPQVTLGINIFEPDFKYEYIIEQSKRLKLKTIRYSITVPSDNKQNGSLEHYESFVPRLVGFLDACHKSGISPHIDCNNPPKCVFSNEQLVDFIYSGFDIVRKGKCSPVMDIRPDLSVARCFCFEDYLSVNIKDFNTVTDLNNFFLKEIDSKRYSNPPFKQCFGCRFWEEKKCIGGCLGYSIKGKATGCCA